MPRIGVSCQIREAGHITSVRRTACSSPSSGGPVEAFFTAALEQYGGRITARESGRYEITRIPAAIRAHAAPGSPVHERYSRVTFDKRAIQPAKLERAELVSPGTSLLGAVVDKVLADHEATLSQGATLVDPLDQGTEPRRLVYLDHTITNGKHIDGQRQVVSRRFQYVEIDRQGNVINRGGEPYVDYAALTDTERSLLSRSGIDDGWANDTAEAAAKSWAIDNLADAHRRDRYAPAGRSESDSSRRDRNNDKPSGGWSPSIIHVSNSRGTDDHRSASRSWSGSSCRASGCFRSRPTLSSHRAAASVSSAVNEGQTWWMSRGTRARIRAFAGTSKRRLSTELQWAHIGTLVPIRLVCDRMGPGAPSATGRFRVGSSPMCIV